MFRTSAARFMARCVATLWAVMSPFAVWGLDPSLDVAQYGHRAWRNVDGFSLGTIGAIAQTTDGYLWLGTSIGLLRFDGVKTLPIAPVPGNAFDDGVRALHGARDGILWIATRHGLFALRRGSIQPETSMSGMAVNAINEGGDGTIWVAGTANGKGTLCAIRHTFVECHDDDDRYGPEILALHRDSANALWIVGIDRAWKRGSDPMVSFALPSTVDALRSVTDMADGAIVIGMRGQVSKIADGRVEALRLPRWTRGVAFDKALRTRDGSLWLGASDSGLIRLHEGRLDTFAASDGLSGDKVLSLFEDREGNVWVSTSRGLDQFRRTAAATQSGVKGLRGRSRAVLSTSDGTLWASTTTGVYQRDASGAWQVRRSWLAGVGSLFEDRRGRIWAPSRRGVQYFDGHAFVDAIGIPTGPIDAITDDALGNLWLAHRELGLLRVQADKANFATTSVSQPSTRVSALAADPLDHSLWVGLWSGNLEKLRDGRVVARFALLDDSSGSPGIGHIRAESDGTLWVSTLGGLVRIAHGSIAKLDVDAGLPCKRVYWSISDGKSLWISGSCGLIRVGRADLDKWVTAAEKGIRGRVAAHLLDNWDGVSPSTLASAIGYATFLNNTFTLTPKMTRTTEGSLWVVAGDSLVSIDPDWKPAAEPPPPVYIEKLVSDGTNYRLEASLRLPPLQNNLEIAYTGLRFASPERVQFRYKMEGRDTDWQYVGNRRQAFYTDLPPGRYRFLVTAASTGDNWNVTPAVQEFEIAPAFAQTRTFQALCVVASVVLLVALMRWRARQLSELERTKLKSTMLERERIARELHDTLLQSNLALILQAHAAVKEMPPDSACLATLQKTLDRAEEVMDEARDRVFDLRRGGDRPDDLPIAIEALGMDLARGSAVFRARTEGEQRRLHANAADEAWSIAGEAILNAFRHANASLIEVLLTYGADALRLSVRDDGQGMNASQLTEGARPGHWGLQGMRERAERLGASLHVRSAPSRGTAIELEIPASAAYFTNTTLGWTWPKKRTARIDSKA